MSFAYVAADHGLDARAKVAEAFDYLRASDLARGIIDGIANAPEIVTIKVGSGLADIYLYPKEGSGRTSGGLVEWDPDLTLDVIDKAKARPQVPWVKDHTKRHGFLWLKKKRIDKPGTISAAMALMHELGHAHQYLTDKEGYEAEIQKNKLLRCLEDTNCAAVENTICLELNARGGNEGIRWDYYHLK